MAIAVTEAFATLLNLCYSYKDIASTIEHCTRWLSRNNEEERNCEDEIHGAISRAIQSKDGEEFRDLGGYILDSFAIAVWGLSHFKSFKEGMIEAQDQVATPTRMAQSIDSSQEHVTALNLYRKNGEMMYICRKKLSTQQIDYRP